MKRLLPILLLLLPYLGGIALLFDPVARSVGIAGTPTVAVPGSSTQATTTATLNLPAPLGLVILDVSRSMKSDARGNAGNDVEFRQTLAAEVFAYVFARVVVDDVSAADKERIHFAASVFPMLPSPPKRPDLQRAKYNGDEKLDAAWMLWPAANGTGTERWLKMDTKDPSGTIKTVHETFERVMGRKGADLRDGGATPHASGARAGFDLIQAYRSAYGPEAAVYAVFMTDEDTSSFTQAADVMRHNMGVVSNGRFELTQVALQNKGQADSMVEQFLKALDLKPMTINEAASATGWTVPEALKRRVLPLVITAADMPEISTDTGAKLEVLGRDGMYYAVFDAREPKLNATKSLKITGKGVRTVKAFTRASWKFFMQPGVYDVMETTDRPKLRLEYDSPDAPKDQSAKEVTLLGPDGKPCGKAQMNYDAAAHGFFATLPELQLGGTQPRVECTALCKMPDGTELKFTFPALRGLSMRWWDPRKHLSTQSVVIPVNPGTAP